jgi:predicted O-methyltransferase YrrM
MSANSGAIAKAAHVGLVLARRPRDIRPYFRLSLQDQRTATEIGLPWFSFGAINYLARRLTGKETVYEYGGGGSTLWLASRVNRVVTIENDPDWHAKLHTALAEQAATNVELIHADANFNDPATFASSSFAQALPAEPADVIIVDSYDFPEPHSLRPLLFEIAEDRIRPGGIIVVDDSWRYPQLRTRNQARQVHTERGVGPSRRSVTSTDFFLY